MSRLILSNLKKQMLILIKRISSFFPDILEHMDEVEQGSFNQISRGIEKEILRISAEKKMLLELLATLKNYEDELREEV